MTGLNLQTSKPGHAKKRRQEYRKEINLSEYIFNLVAYFNKSI